jgi:tetratricopeptide (TPR) repeat protein
MITESIRLFGDDPRSLVAESWLALSDYQAGDFDSAMILSGKLLQEELDGPTRFRVLLLRSSIYWSKGLPDQAFAELALMESLYDQCCAWAKGTFHLHRGLVLRTLGETDRAIVDYDSAIHFFEVAGNVRWQAVAANNLSHVYLVTKEFPSAHRHAAKARDLFHELGDKTYEAKALDQIALVYLAEGKPNPARSAITEALDLVEFGEIRNECLQTCEKIKRALQEDDPQTCVSMPPAQALSLAHNDNVTPSPPERQSVMSPLECASMLIQHSPDNAVYLLDFMILLRTVRDDPQFDAQLDATEEMLWAKTPEAQRLRSDYRQSRLVHDTTANS